MTSTTSATSRRLLVLRRWTDLTLQALGVAREEIDALNVYPVPDGDTGTNLYLTFEAARAALYAADPQDEAAAWDALARGALLGARGNSGVILSQLLRAGARSLVAAGELDAERLARALVAAADAGYESVGDPVEGTILTVARAAADAATTAAADGDVGVTIRTATDAAREALARTPEQLETLRLAGVVDAGGRGLVVILEAAQTALTGHRPVTPTPTRGSHLIPMPTPGVDLSPGGPGYEVMYLLDADDGAVPALRRALAPLGDSLVVVGGDGLWNVHVHVDDVGAAIEAGITAGRPHRIRVTHFAEQTAARRPGDGERPAGTATRVVVAAAAGPGLAAVFEDAGAAVVHSSPGRRCSTGDVLAAIRGSGAHEVVVLPNDSDSVAVAEAAAREARDEGIRVAVVPTRVQVQGLAALAVHEPGRSFEDDVVHMTAAAGHTRHGGVTVAARDAMTMAGPCRVGDALGIVEGDFAVVGTDLTAVTLDVVDRLVGGGGEMVTLVSGAGGDPSLVRSVLDHLRDRPHLETVVYDGGQERYPLLIAVE
ncbi:MAG TPA: DAK2 domain-containing protein [Nocardioidaceae bacterium]|nr:DAK2 domain-containing protein [Nocardioidaceae bacterium]